MKLRVVLVLALTVVFLTGCGQNPSKEVPQNVSMLNNLGFRYASQGDTAKAKYYFNKALEIDSDHETSRKNLALINFKEKNFTAAETHFKVLIENNPDNASYHYDLAIALSQKCKLRNECGDLNESIKHFNISANLKPGYANAEENMRVLKRVRDSRNNQSVNESNSTR